MSACLCLGGGYKPISEEAKKYIASLPVYQKYENKGLSLNIAPGAYHLPFSAYSSQWKYLRNIFNQFKDPRGILPDFWHSLPGISEILIDQPVFFFMDEYHDGFGGYGSLRIGGQTKGHKTFCPKSHLRFAPTIPGAKTAFFLKTDYRHFFNFWHAMAFCDEGVITHKRDKDNDEFAEAFNEDVTIPCGIRIEIIQPGHYIVSALADGFMRGLWDIHVEVCDGKIVGDFEGEIFVRNPDDPNPPQSKPKRQWKHLLHIAGDRFY